MTASEKRLMTVQGFYSETGGKGDLTVGYKQDIYSNIDTILS